MEEDNNRLEGYVVDDGVIHLGRTLTKREITTVHLYLYEKHGFPTFQIFKLRVQLVLCIITDFVCGIFKRVK